MQITMSPGWPPGSVTREGAPLHGALESTSGTNGRPGGSLYACGPSSRGGRLREDQAQQPARGVLVVGPCIPGPEPQAACQIASLGRRSLFPSSEMPSTLAPPGTGEKGEAPPKLPALPCETGDSGATMQHLLPEVGVEAGVWLTPTRELLAHWEGHPGAGPTLACCGELALLIAWLGLTTPQSCGAQAAGCGHRRDPCPSCLR